MNSENKKINMGFWATLPKPFFVLAPMADVTDAAFRRIVAKYSRHEYSNGYNALHEGARLRSDDELRRGKGGPDVFWTEFVSCDGLIEGRAEALMKDLMYSEEERPIVAQLFTSKPENMRAAAELCAKLGFDGIDINMGCPDRSIMKQMCGAEMINHPDIAIKVIAAAKEGAPGLPVSVKTRIGFNRPEIDTWIKTLLEQDIAVLSVHARTKKEMSSVPANWDYVKQIVDLRDSMGKQTLIIGNGDVHTLEDGHRRIRATGADGAMIGRAIFGNPWLFDSSRNIVKAGKYLSRFWGYVLPRKWVKKIEGDNRYTVSSVSKREKLLAMIEHAELFEQLLGDVKNFSVMKKHYKAYCNNFPGAKELRVKLMSETETAKDVRRIIEEYLQTDTADQLS